MGNRPSLHVSRVALAVAGAIIVGSIGAAVAVMPTLPFGIVLAGVSPPQANVAPSPTATAASTPTTAPTPTTRPRPTSPPAPTRTPVPTLEGVVSEPPGTSSFSLLVGGVTWTVNVTSSTTFSYQGTLSSLSALQVNWHTVARGAYQTGASHTFLASRVSSCSTLCDT